MNKARRARQKANKLKGWPEFGVEDFTEVGPPSLEGSNPLIPRDKDTELVTKADSE